MPTSVLNKQADGFQHYSLVSQMNAINLQIFIE